MQQKGGDKVTPRRGPVFTIRPSRGLLVRSLDGVQVAAALETLGRDEALAFGAIVI